MRERIADYVGIMFLSLLAAQCAFAARKGGAPGITVSAPATASAGEVISITVTPVSEATLTDVIVGTDRGGAVGFSSTAPYSFSYVVPLDIVGALTINAVATDVNANAVYDAKTVVQVGTTSATLTSLALHINTTLQGTWSKNMFLDYYMETQRINIEGTYSDGITRDLSSPASGTTYASQDTNIAKILPDGSLQAMGQGGTTVTAANSGISLVIGVQVDFVDPNRGSRTGGSGTNMDVALTYSNPVTLVTPAGTTTSNILPYSGPITLPSNASSISFPFHNNSGLPQLGVARGLVTWKLAGGSNANCSVSFVNNALPTDLTPYAVTDGTITFALPIGGGKCVVNVNIAGLPDSQADKFTITNPAP
jgi:hypothetical protein